MKYLKKAEPWDVKSSKTYKCFPYTKAINTYTTIRLAHDDLNRRVSKELEKWKLSVPKYGVIRQLYNHNSLTLTELSQKIFSGNSNLTTLIDRMEGDGLVERVEGDTDRRIKKVRLTKKGLALAPRVVEEYRRFLHQMVTKCLTHDEQRMLTNLLQKIVESLP